MSFLDHGPHSVVVTPKVKVLNRYGDFDLIDSAPVTVSGVSVQPVARRTLNSLGNGMQINSTHRIIGRGPWPGGVHSTIVYDGREWDQSGEAEVHNTGFGTHHFTVLIRAQSAEVK